jgi:glutathione S-transferase
MRDFKIIGSEESPYSVKVRAYLAFKQLPYTWLQRSQASKLYQLYAKLPIVPLVVTPGGKGLQDSTPIIEYIEAQHPQPGISPPDPVCQFVSHLLEEFADEWGNKWMFHYRWAREADQIACALRLATAVLPNGSELELNNMAQEIRVRMMDRVWFVGSSPSTAQTIEASFRNSLELLQVHLSHRPYLFGGRPSLADFGLWGQLYNCFRDPTPSALMNRHAPAVVGWIERMLAPEIEGEFEPWASLAPSLETMLQDQVAGLFLPWSAANAKAIEAGDDTLTVMLGARSWQQQPQKYHAKSLRALRDKFAEVAHQPDICSVMARTGCLAFLQT